MHPLKREAPFLLVKGRNNRKEILITWNVTLILSLIFKNIEKEDKGFEFFYHKLTYRRKMIRTVWSLPVFVVSLIVIYFFADLILLEFLMVSIFFFVLFLIQLIYNYIKWKKYEREYDKLIGVFKRGIGRDNQARE
ncbi:hypothetical protein [Oceanobacillus piezotolerans]|uniref:hypothetical protein n=1 Tax=Oceanobacillus piezotolerans TaxID=2448030 RepID=UPI001656F73F|nr:hypothetical protein [Oceanobacillus piezotolerans]